MLNGVFCCIKSRIVKVIQGWVFSSVVQPQIEAGQPLCQWERVFPRHETTVREIVARDSLSSGLLVTSSGHRLGYLIGHHAKP